MISFGGVGVPGFGVSDPVGLGTLERRNPLPTGRYWIDLFAPHNAEWLAWRVRNAQSVKIEETEHFAPEDNAPERDFVIFNVSAPVSWEGPGFPTVAGADVKNSTDTSNRPPPTKDPTDVGADLVESLLHPSPTAVAIGTIVALVAGGGLALYVIHRATSTGRRSDYRSDHRSEPA